MYINLRSFLRLFILTASVHSLFFAPFAHAIEKFPLIDRIVAVVNRDAISESELNRQTQLLMLRLRHNEMTMPSMSELRKQILEKMVLEKLQLQMAKDSGIEITKENLDQAIDDIAKRDELTVDQMKQFLEDQGITFAQFRENIKNEMIISKLQQREVGQHISISNSEIEQFLKSPSGQDQSGVEYRLGHILIALPEAASAEQIKLAEKKADDLSKQLKTGGNFSELAMAKSAGPQALNGGDLGFRTTQELPTLFAKEVTTLEKGQLLGPIRNESGFHIIKLLDKRSANNQDPKASKETLRSKAMDAIFQRRFEEKLATWLRRVKDDAEVQIYLNEKA